MSAAAPSSAAPSHTALASAASLAAAQLACTAAQALVAAASPSCSTATGHTHIPSRSAANTNGISEAARSISDALEQQLKGVISVILDLTEACVSASSDMLASGDAANAAKVRARFAQSITTACSGLTFSYSCRTPSAFDDV